MFAAAGLHDCLISADICQRLAEQPGSVAGSAGRVQRMRASGQRTGGTLRACVMLASFKVLLLLLAMLLGLRVGEAAHPGPQDSASSGTGCSSAGTVADNAVDAYHCDLDDPDADCWQE